MADSWVPDPGSAQFRDGGLYFEAEADNDRWAYWLAPKHLQGGGTAAEVLIRSLPNVRKILASIERSGPALHRLN